MKWEDVTSECQLSLDVNNYGEGGGVGIIHPVSWYAPGINVTWLCKQGAAKEYRIRKETFGDKSGFVIERMTDGKYGK